MKREKTPPPRKRPGSTRPRSSGAAKSRKPAAAPKSQEPDVSEWTDGEKELHQLAVSQGKQPIKSIDELVFLTPEDGEELLDAIRQSRRPASKVRRKRERDRR